MATAQLRIERAELVGITVVECFGFVELRVARSRRVGADELDPVDRRGLDIERAREVIGVRAVDPEVQRGAVGGDVDVGDGLMQRLSAWEPAVGFDREGDDRRDARSDRGADDAIASPVCVAVSIVTRPAPAAANDSIWGR